VQWVLTENYADKEEPIHEALNGGCQSSLLVGAAAVGQASCYLSNLCRFADKYHDTCIASADES
jgi:hypothetical protein